MDGIKTTQVATSYKRISPTVKGNKFKINENKERNVD